MIKVYIASPYWHENYIVRCENVMNQIHVANTLIDAGYAPFWPLHSHFVAQRYARAESEWLALSCEWVKQCDVLLRLRGESKGADEEVALAHDYEIEVYYDMEVMFKEFPSV